MRNITLVVPKLEEYSYKEWLEKDKNTMSYNAGYDVKYSGYHYDTGCIDFNIDKWKDDYKRRINENMYFAYIKDFDINKYVGYVNYYYNKNDDIYECGILIEYKYRGKGYSKDALKLLIKEAYNNGIEYLYDTFEKDRQNALKLFLDVGFKIYKEETWKKFNKDVLGVVVRINTSSILPNISKIRNNKKDYKLLYKWCKNKQVYEYFDKRKLKYSEIVDKFKTKLMGEKQELFIIRLDNKNIGLMQIYKYKNDLKIEKLNKYRNIYEYDLFVYDNYLNMDLSEKIIMCINDMIYKKYSADGILLRLFKRDTKAIKCCLNCDFKEIYSDTNSNKEEIVVLLNEPDRWKFGMKPNALAKLVLNGKKTATTSLYRYENLAKPGDFSVIIDASRKSVCAIKTKKVIIKKFKDITWDLVKLEGENDSLEDWRKSHINYFSKIDKEFNCNTKVIFEIFEVLKKWK